jgi:hypothetical protein
MTTATLYVFFSCDFVVIGLWNGARSLEKLTNGKGCIERNPEKGREAAAPSNIKEIQEIQGGQEAPLDGDAINPKDA